MDAAWAAAELIFSMALVALLGICIWLQYHRHEPARGRAVYCPRCGGIAGFKRVPISEPPAKRREWRLCGRCEERA